MSLPADRSAGLSRPLACVLVMLVWAAIYLPALGSLELKGEEGRRLLPAVAMLDGAGWIVPQIGGIPYLSKPPLINWLAAAAFRVEAVWRGRGAHGEWAARAPSVLAVLALALTITGVLSELLTPRGALFAAVCTLTNLGLMEKGRLAEIEALYISLFGIAFVLWLAAWRRDALAAEVGGLPRAAWRTWTLPWLFLGLGLLTKGPLHLLFFYALVLAISGCAGRWRPLGGAAHGAGVVLMLGLFALWAVPYLHATATDRAGGVWLAQFKGRLEVDETFHLGTWLLNVPRGLINYLPWTVLLPLLWRPLPEADPGTDRAILRGGRWAILGAFLAVSLAPGGQPRYTLPLLVPASILLALACRRGWGDVEVDGALPPALGAIWTRVAAVCLLVAGVLAPWAALCGGGRLPAWLAAAAGMVIAAVGVLRVVPWKQPPAWERPRPYQLVPLTLASAAAMALLTLDYALGVVPLLRAHESVRPAARAINRAVASAPFLPERGAAVTVLRPGFLPFLFYLRPDPEYVQSVDALAPRWTRSLLVREDELPAARSQLEALGNTATDAVTVVDKRSKDPQRNRWHLLIVRARANDGF